MSEFRLQFHNHLVRASKPSGYIDGRSIQPAGYRFARENGWSPYGGAWWPTVDQAHLALEAALAGIPEFIP